MSEHTQKRDRAQELAPSDWREALVLAERIDDPWFACQAIAGVARFAPDDKVRRIAMKAIGCVEAEEDAFRYIGASAWPLRALIERGEEKAVPPLLDAMLARSQQVTPTGSRAEALSLVLHSVFLGKASLWHRVFEELFSQQSAVMHWRKSRAIADAIQLVASKDLDLAKKSCAQLANDKLRRKVAARLSRREFLRPRSFVLQNPEYFGRFSGLQVENLELFLYRWRDWEFCADNFPRVFAPFVCLFIADATAVHFSKIGPAMEAVEARGCQWIATWGPDCERVHDIFDEQFVMRNLENPDAGVMSSWHSKESLESALWFALCSVASTKPARKFRSLLVCCEERDGWPEIVAKALSNPSDFESRML